VAKAKREVRKTRVVLVVAVVKWMVIFKVTWMYGKLLILCGKLENSKRKWTANY
jgi:hypothetical protein